MDFCFCGTSWKWDQLQLKYVSTVHDFIVSQWTDYLMIFFQEFQNHRFSIVCFLFLFIFQSSEGYVVGSINQSWFDYVAIIPGHKQDSKQKNLVALQTSYLCLPEETDSSFGGRRVSRMCQEDPRNYSSNSLFIIVAKQQSRSQRNFGNSTKSRCYFHMSRG